MRMQTAVTLSSQAYRNLKPINKTVQRIADAKGLERVLPQPHLYVAVWINDHYVLPRAAALRVQISLTPECLFKLRQLALKHNYRWGSQPNVSALLEVIGLGYYTIIPKETHESV